MADFQNTIDLYGDENVLNMLLEGTLSEFKDDVITTIGFMNCAGFCGYIPSLIEVDLPNLVSTPGSRTFAYNENVRNYNLPKYKGTFGSSNTFNNNKMLESIYLPEYSTDKAELYFDSCTNLKYVYAPKTTNFPYFGYCTSLISIDVRSITSCNLSSSSLRNCSSLQSIKLPATPPSLSGASYLSNINPACKFYIPTGSLEAYQAATNWSSVVETYDFVEEDRDA